VTGRRGSYDESVATLGEIFDNEIRFDPAGDFEAFRLSAPAKWVVYLLADENDRPVQLLCVKNLRYSLERRLGLQPIDAGPSKRIDYREIVRRVYWRRVDSAFEADVVYLAAARELFPKTYRGMVGFRPAWFVHVNPEHNFPRYVKTIDATSRAGRLFGPLEDKHDAARLIEIVEDSFDLCRYYHVLVEAPNAMACAYKEMGKCPAPCDGSISMPQYRRMIEWSADTLADPTPLVREHTQRMHDAAKELRFETAAKIRALIEQLQEIRKGPFRYVRPIEQFNFVALQTGPKNGTAKVFLITRGRIEHVASLIDEPRESADLLRLLLELKEQRRSETVDETGGENIGVVAQHLFTAKAAHGAFIQIDSLDERGFAKAYRDLLKQKSVAETVGEGVTRELQAL
jgi:excinuclease UvrABC nuclease subunit